MGGHLRWSVTYCPRVTNLSYSIRREKQGPKVGLKRPFKIMEPFAKLFISFGVWIVSNGVEQKLWPI